MNAYSVVKIVSISLTIKFEISLWQSHTFMDTVIQIQCVITAACTL